MSCAHSEVLSAKQCTTLLLIHPEDYGVAWVPPLAYRANHAMDEKCPEFETATVCGLNGCDQGWVRGIEDVS